MTGQKNNLDKKDFKDISLRQKEPNYSGLFTKNPITFLDNFTDHQIWFIL
jgi:hypothetical protein